MSVVTDGCDTCVPGGSRLPEWHRRACYEGWQRGELRPTVSVVFWLPECLCWPIVRNGYKAKKQPHEPRSGAMGGRHLAGKIQSAPRSLARHLPRSQGFKARGLLTASAIDHLLLQPLGFVHVLIGQLDHPIHFLGFANFGRLANG